MQAIVGANAFAHESGIHQDGMLKSKETYEIITPEEIGLVRQDEAGIVMGEPLQTLLTIIHPSVCAHQEVHLWAQKSKNYLLRRKAVCVPAAPQ